MGITILLFTLAVLYIFVLKSFLESDSTYSRNKSIKIHNHGHGHRCYTEGLSRSEYKIVELLAHNLDHNKYFIFNNIILPSQNTETTQIDHIVVSRYGIFVIESKEVSGWIFANNSRKHWTQTFPRGRKYSMYNPILQNYCHVSAIKNQLGFIGNRIFNVVVFSGDCEFKTEKPENVFYEHELIDYIKSKLEIVLKEVELLVVIGKLSMLCQVTETTNEEHAQNVENWIKRDK
jgi:restriction system protein